MDEEWRTVPGFNWYEVSNLGRVRSVERVITRSDGRKEHRHGKLLKLCEFGRKREYLGLTVSNNSGSFRVGVHTLVHLAFVGPIPVGYEIDHKDRNKRNNAPANLRAATRSQNHANRPSPKSGSGVKGVSWDQKRQRWVAKIKVNQKAITLGRFRDVADAKQAYQNAARKYFGEFCEGA